MSEYLERPDARGYLKACEALRRWDPIGVYGPDSHWPEDEYDSYAAPIVRLLDRGVTVRQLTKVLRGIARSEMGLATDHRRDKATAIELVEFWKAWKGSCKSAE